MRLGLIAEAAITHTEEDKKNGHMYQYMKHFPGAPSLLNNVLLKKKAKVGADKAAAVKGDFQKLLMHTVLSRSTALLFSFAFFVIKAKTLNGFMRIKY